MPPSQHEDEDGTIVNPGGNMAPGLNRGDKIDKPENPNKPDKPENPGTEDKDDKKANKANKGTHVYTYDELNRMVSSEIAKELTNYTYDTLGNLVLESVKNKSVDYEYNELNQLVRKTTSTNEVFTYTYDARGNRIAETGKKASQSFVYDATNRLVEGTNWKGDTSAYTYNGLGLRVNNLVTTHAGKTYDRDYVIDYTSPENDDLYVYALGNGQLEYEQRHVYAGSERLEQITEKGNGGWERTLYVHEDVMGNTRYYTKATGQTFAELQYDAWGQPVSPNKLVNNDHGNYVFATFTGHIYDTTLDIYFAEARFYDATNRTWMAMDPIKDGLNWYQYCLSNPTTNWDPTGLAAYGAMPQYFEQMSGCSGMAQTPYAAGLQNPALYGVIARRLQYDGYLTLVAGSASEYTTKVYQFVYGDRTIAIIQGITYINGDGLVVADTYGMDILYQQLVADYQKSISNYIIVEDIREGAYTSINGSNYQNATIKVIDSYQVKSADEQRAVIRAIQNYTDMVPASAEWNRNSVTMQLEWAAHNIQYDFSTLTGNEAAREQAKNVDFDADILLGLKAFLN